MTIQVGESLPQVTFRIMTADGPVAKTTDDLFKGRNVVLVAVPGRLHADLPPQSPARLRGKPAGHQGERRGCHRW